MSRAERAPRPDGVLTLDDLAAALVELRAWAGNPSYAALAVRVGELRAGAARGGRPGKVTVYDCFRPGRRRLDGELVLDLVRVLGAPTADIEVWRSAYGRAHGVSPGAGAASDPRPRRPLVGRSDLVREIALRPPGSVTALLGLAGVGKTELALHVLALCRQEFGPACRTVAVDVRGFDPERPPLDPAVVLARLLEGVGATPQAYDALDVAGRRALLWATLAAGPAVVLLDNVRDETALAALLPVPSRARVLVTSRRTIGAVAPGQTSVVLTELAEDAAIRLLESTAGRDLGTEDPDAVRRIVRACGRMALDLTVAGASVRAQPDWTLDDHAARLESLPRDERLRPALRISYELLSPDCRATFRALALHPGPDLTEWAVAALAGVPDDVAADHLDELTTEHLVRTDPMGRHHLHDLVRDFALQLGVVTDPRSAQRAACRRLVDAAVRELAAHAPAGDPEVGWIRAEQGSLVAVAEAAPGWGEPSAPAALVLLLADHFEVTGQWALADGLCRLALREGADNGVRRLLARSLEMRGRLDEALAELERAHDPDDLSDSEASRVVNGIGNIHKQRGHYRLAARSYVRAVRLARARGQEQATGRALGNLADTLRLLGHPRISAELYDACEHHAHAAGDDIAIAIARSNRPLLAEALGDLHGAVRLGRVAVASLEEMGFASLAAISRGWVARHCVLVGDLDAAQPEIERAHEELTRHEHGEALALLRVTRGQLLHGRGETAAAERELTAALTEARHSGWGSPEVDATLALGDLAAAVGDTAVARERYTAAITLATRHGRRAELERARVALERVRPASERPLPR
ncbi:ATP-binding protein [Nocardioides daejeonensis]|uniref:ATP-binding protein n=1 Tax=Nocardioides daejeonensis TaxID=1046556 RepID=UPI0013A58171|nr:hypothetical protein [Nocardioides daejeonensis]